MARMRLVLAVLVMSSAASAAGCSGASNNGQGGAGGSAGTGAGGAIGGRGGVMTGVGGIVGGAGGSGGVGSAVAGVGGRGGGSGGGGSGAGGSGAGGSACGGQGGTATAGTGGDMPGTDLTWAEWPVPNGRQDVSGGAPNPAAYTDNGDQTVTDDVTGLMWQKAAPEDSYSLAQATAYCETLTLGGHSDWRIPTRIELVSLLDLGPTLPCIDTAHFPGTLPAPYWTSSVPAGAPSSRFSVDFASGATGGLGAGSSVPVRCVRNTRVGAPAGPFTAAPAAPGRYTYPAPGTIHDTRTKLTWQQNLDPPYHDAAGARAYCAGLGATLGGTGWRLPTIKELQTIVDESRLSPTIDPTAFPGTPTQLFWSSSLTNGTPTKGFVVNFNDASAYSHNLTYRTYARCVTSSVAGLGCPTGDGGTNPPPWRSGSVTVGSLPEATGSTSTILGAAFIVYPSKDDNCTHETHGPCDVTVCGTPVVPFSYKAAGTLTFSSDAMTAELREFGNGTYHTGHFSGELWSQPGSTVTVIAPGGEVPAFTGQVTSPAVLSMPSSSVMAFSTARRGNDIALTWQGSGPCRATFTFFVRQGNTPTTYNASCSFPSSDGQGTIPAAALMAIPAGLKATYTFDCVAITNFVAGDWDIRLRAYAAARTADGLRATSALGSW
jgi:hypothetical protein